MEGILLSTPVGMVDVCVGTFTKHAKMENILVVEGPACNHAVAALMKAAMKNHVFRASEFVVSTDGFSANADHVGHMIHVSLYDADDVDDVIRGILSIPGSYRV